MPDYKCGKVYAIVGEDGLEVYVGSTTQPLHKRWHEHKQYVKKKPERSIYKHIAECGGIEKFRIILVEEYPCENKQQLLRREGEHIKRLQPVGNRRVAGRTQQEWTEEHKDRIAEKKREYREENKDKIAERMRAYREEIKDKIAEQKRAWREKNKDKIAEQKREYRERNKDKIAEYRERNKDVLLERARDYYEQNRDEINRKKKERYARKKADQASTSAQ